ncbi:MAG: S-methyl-5-thioribose-1-phosphate isomerase [Acidimicrobiia bacterium]|nr:S-methyl-5-thioribose-1-phosphate isomerase [Acidimicrobiia bacterium]
MTPAGEPLPPTIEWRRGRLRLIDQRELPERLTFVVCSTVEDLCEAISTLAVRGAPALGAAGAYGVAMAALGAPAVRGAARVRAAARRIVATRPTAVNLAWGVERALAALAAGGASAALEEAHRIAAHDVAANRALGAHGAALVPDRARVLTHCNAGSLAAVGYGTALGVIRAAAEAGKAPRVWVDETRPLLQGARITAWELDRLGIEATLIPDVAAGSLMAAGEVDLVVVGADRIAVNGDVANKIGTYALAVLARHHGIPFYVAAPVSTIDVSTRDGGAIAIEERDGAEVTSLRGVRIAPRGFRAFNPAFDVTPARFVTALVTEAGVVRPPYRRAIARLAGSAVRRVAES